MLGWPHTQASYARTFLIGNVAWGLIWAGPATGMARRVCTNAVALATELGLLVCGVALHVYGYAHAPLGRLSTTSERAAAAGQVLVATWTLSALLLLSGPVRAAKKYGLWALTAAHGASLLFLVHATAELVDALTLRAGLAMLVLSAETFAWVLRLQLVCLSRSDRQCLAVPFYRREEKPRMYLFPHA